MQLSFNLTLELKRSSCTSASSSDSTSRPGAREKSPPSYDAIISAGGLAPNNSFSLSSRRRKRIPTTTDASSHREGFRNPFKKMFAKFTGAHNRSHPAELHGSVPATWPIPEGIHELPISHDASEISGSQLPLEMPASRGAGQPSDLSNRGIWQQYTNHGGLQGSRPSAATMHNEKSRHYDYGQYGPHHIDTSTDQQHWPQQTFQDSMSTRITPRSTWTSSPQDLSPSEGHSLHSSQSPVVTAAAASHSKFASTGGSIAFAASIPTTEVSSRGQKGLAGPFEGWNNKPDRYDTFSQSLPPYLASPPYVEPKQGYETDHSISPVSGHHNADTHGPAGASTLPLTPPGFSPFDKMMEVSPKEQLHKSFGEYTSSPSSQVFDQHCLTAVPVAMMVDSTHHVYMSPTHYTERHSLWERQIPQAQRLYRHGTVTSHAQAHDENADLISGVDETLPFNEKTTGQLYAQDFNATRPADVASAYVTKSRRSAVDKFVDTFVERVLAPLSCGQCKVEFNGEYQKGNRERHIRRFHGAVTVYRCRSCSKVYKRDDARKKHEWKKHDASDCRPDKRRPEKRAGEKSRVAKSKAMKLMGK